MYTFSSVLVGEWFSLENGSHRRRWPEMEYMSGWRCIIGGVGFFVFVFVLFLLVNTLYTST